MSKRNKKRSRIATEKVSRSSKRSQPKDSGRRSRAWRLLLICVLLLVVGLAVRFYLQQQFKSQVLVLKTNLAAAERQRDWSQVEVLAREWATLEPGEYLPWRHAADAAIALGDFSMAAEYLLQVPDGSPLESYLDLGSIQMEELNQPLAAKATCEETLKYYPNDSETHERLLFIYTMTCQPEEIEREAQRALDLKCDTLATYAYLFGARWLTFINGYDMNQLWLQSQPNSEMFEVAAVLHLRSNQLLQELARADEVDEANNKNEVEDSEPKLLEFAREQVKQLREKFPENVELLAAELANLCTAGEVIQVAERLADAPPETLKDNRFWRFKGWFHSEREEWDEAVTAYEKALAITPWDWQSQFEMASALRFRDGLEASTEMAERANLGRSIQRGIQRSPLIYRLEPTTLYDDLESYFRRCGEAELADRLKARVAAAGL